MEAEQRIEGLGLTLPPPNPVGNYICTVKTGNLLFVSGHDPYNDGITKTSGKVGQELTVEEDYQAAKSTTLNCLASARKAIGDLDEIKRVVNYTEDFKGSPTGFRCAS